MGTNIERMGKAARRRAKILALRQAGWTYTKIGKTYRMSRQRAFKLCQMARNEKAD